MILAHTQTQSNHHHYLWIQFSLEGHPLASDAYSHDCMFIAECGPYVLMQYGDYNRLFMFDATAIAWNSGRERFTGSGTVPLVWLSPRAVSNVRVSEDIRTVMRDMAPNPAFLKPASKDGDLLAKVQIAGATITSFEVQSPTARLFGGTGSKGYVLTLPDSSRKHVLDSGDDGMPVLTDDARVDIHRFLSK